MSYVKKNELTKQGFSCLAGPFAPYEEYMVPGFVADAKRAGKDTAVSVESHGLYVWQRSRIGR
jgi:hypothetical protein